MMDITPVSLNDFIEREPERPEISEEVLKARHAHDLHRQLLDVWGEVDATMSLYDKWKKKKADLEDVLSQLECVHRCCYTVYSDEKSSKGIIWELKVAEWELLDFVLWGNTFNNSRKSVTLWFDEWCYNTNF